MIDNLINCFNKPRVTSNAFPSWTSKHELIKPSFLSTSSSRILVLRGDYHENNYCQIKKEFLLSTTHIKSNKQEKKSFLPFSVNFQAPSPFRPLTFLDIHSLWSTHHIECFLWNELSRWYTTKRFLKKTKQIKPQTNHF